MNIDPETLVDVENNLVIQPVNVNGQMLHLATEFDPEELEDMDEMEKLNFWGDLGNKIKAAAQKAKDALVKVGSNVKKVADNVINGAKPLVHKAADFLEKNESKICSEANSLNPSLGGACHKIT